MEIPDILDELTKEMQANKAKRNALILQKTYTEADLREIDNLGQMNIRLSWSRYRVIEETLE